MANAVLTEHARNEIARRELSEQLVHEVLATPGQCFEVRPGRLVYQSIVDMPDGGVRSLVRVFVDVDREPPEIVTVYRTSRIDRYWRR